MKIRFRIWRLVHISVIRVVYFVTFSIDYNPPRTGLRAKDWKLLDPRSMELSILNNHLYNSAETDLWLRDVNKKTEKKWLIF